MPRILGSWAAKRQFDLTEDGKTITFVVETPDIDANLINIDLWVAPTDNAAAGKRLLRLRGQGKAGMPQIPASNSTALVNPAFSPDGRKIAVVGYGVTGRLAVINVGTGAVTILSAGLGDRFQDVAWAPDGRSLAALYSQPDRHMIRTGVDVGVDWDGRSLAPTTSRIAIIDARRDQLVATTPETLVVAGISSAFSWSSDGTRLAFSAHPVERGDFSFQDDDIYLFDLAAGTTRPFITQPGPDLDPQWSPDGRSLAYLTASGVGGFGGGFALGISDLATGHRRLLTRSDETAQTPYAISWFDPGHIAFVAMRRMGCPLFLVETASLAVQQISPDDLACMGGARRGAGATVYTVSHSFAHAAQLVASPILRWAPVAIAPAAPMDRIVTRESVVAWPSTDGIFTVHGVLIEPAGRPGRKAPLLVTVAGGPGMVTPGDYNQDAQHLIYPALLRGYAVLIPNTRGRGGYDAAFASAIVDRRDYMPGPFEDVVAGVDYLARAGIVDLNKVALVGFSYGAILSAYAATTTDRFRVVMATEGAADFYSRALAAYGSVAQSNGQSILGFADPFDPSDRRLLTQQSPLLRAAGVRVPVLLECGSESLAATDCLKFFRTVRRQSPAPIDLIVYPRTGHGITEPALRYDSAMRQTAWLDHWMAQRPPQYMADRDAHRAVQ